MSRAGSCDILIIGAGITGLCTAIQAARQGAKVTVLDACQPGAGASGRSGAILRSSCPTACETQLALRALHLFAHWPAHFGGSCGFEPREVWTVAESSAAGFEAWVRQLNEWGSPIRAYPERPDQFTWFPGEKLAVEPNAGSCDPNAALRTVLACAVDRGVLVLCGQRASALIVDGGRCDGAVAGEARYTAAATLVAAGAWSHALLAASGIHLPLSSRLVRVSTFDHICISDWQTLPVVIDEAAQAWFRPISGQGILVGAEATGEAFDGLGNVPLAASEWAVARHAKLLARRFGVSGDLTPRGSWAGIYGTCVDGLPVVGATSRLRGLFLAAGDGGACFKYAPALGEVLADLMLDARRALPDLRDLSPDRFGLLEAVADATREVECCI